MTVEGNVVDRAKARELLAQLREYEAKGDSLSVEDFHAAVKAVMDQHIATDRKLSIRFRVSISIIDRWQRITAPVLPAMRRSVIAGLIEEVEAALS